MRISLLLVALIATSCVPSQEQRYPGVEAHWERCHSLWDLGYKSISVPACEKHMDNPKYKRGQKIKLRNLDNSCVMQVIMPSWSGPMDKPFYTGRTLCNGQPLFGENERTDFLESEVVDEKKFR